MLGDRSIKADLLLKLAVIYHKIALSQLGSAKIEDISFGDGMQKVNKAIEIYQEALSIYEELRDIDGQVEVHFSQAALYYNLRMYPEALPRYEAALQILAEHGKDNTEVSNMLRDQIIKVKNKIADK